MLLFLAFFLLIYGSLHLYFFLKASAALSLSAGANLLLGVILAALMLAPLIVHWLERLELVLNARIIAYIGYSWMGVLFLFFASSLVIDAYRLLAHAGGWLAHRDVATLTLSARPAFLIPLTLSLVISIYGFFEARNVRLERISIESQKIPSNPGRFKIAQISDLHLGLTVGKAHLKKVVALLKAENPDLLVCTGDLVDAGLCDGQGLAEPLKEIQPRYGKYAVTGNHEFYAGLDQALESLREAGFTVLRGETARIDDVLNVAGVDDPEAGRFGLADKIDERELLAILPEGRFTLFLKHRPNVEEGSVGRFDLMLSGHTHKGQIFPFNLLVRPFYTADAGFLNLGKGSSLYVSRGTGSWGPPIRFLAPPEVTIIEVRGKDEK